MRIADTSDESGYIDSNIEYSEFQRFVSVSIAGLLGLSALDMPEAVAETVLSVFESPPFSLLEVDSKTRNFCVGRLRFQPIGA